MDTIVTDWLPGWEVVVRPVGVRTVSVYECYLQECRLMQYAGGKLFSQGVLPEYSGTSAGPKLQNGTGGNFAARNRTYPKRFVVTASGTHKGKLIPQNFVEILSVNWGKRQVTIKRNSPTALPSTDSLLVAAAFEINPQISAWVHFHEPLPSSHSIKLNYPSLSIGDRLALTKLISSGARIINMIDHNMFIKKEADGTADAVIVLDNTIGGAFSKVTKVLFPMTP